MTGGSWPATTSSPPIATAAGAPWHTWLVLGGRGSGKTRAGAEWVRAQAPAISPTSPTGARTASRSSATPSPRCAAS